LAGIILIAFFTGLYFVKSRYQAKGKPERQAERTVQGMEMQFEASEELLSKQPNVSADQQPKDDSKGGQKPSN